MILYNKSLWSGKMNHMEVSLTPEEYIRGEQARKDGKMIQEAFPQLNAEQREFILSGMTPDEWQDAWATSDEATWEFLRGKDQ